MNAGLEDPLGGNQGERGAARANWPARCYENSTKHPLTGQNPACVETRSQYMTRGVRIRYLLCVLFIHRNHPVTKPIRLGASFLSPNFPFLLLPNPPPQTLVHSFFPLRFPAIRFTFVRGVSLLLHTRSP